MARAEPLIIAIDWSGSASTPHRNIWLAEVGPAGPVRLEHGRNREQITDHLIEVLRTSDRPLLVGIDFAFSLPAWFMHKESLADGPALWKAAAENSLCESWLQQRPWPFFGRAGSKRPAGVEMFRRTEKGDSAKSVFQIHGPGAVGTGSLRGMPTLHRLKEAGFAVWPFTPPSRATVFEIYPRALTGAVNKSNGPARNQYLRANFPTLAPQFLAAAAASEDAFDALVSALVMWDRRSELLSLRPGDDLARVEGEIWRPARP